MVTNPSRQGGVALVREVRAGEATKKSTTNQEAMASISVAPGEMACYGTRPDQADSPWLLQSFQGLIYLCFQ